MTVAYPEIAKCFRCEETLLKLIAIAKQSAHLNRYHFGEQRSYKASLTTETLDGKPATEELDLSHTLRMKRAMPCG